VVALPKSLLLLVFLRGLREFVVQIDGKSLVVCGELRGNCGVLATRF
jgi:hypothetical protein